MKPPYHKHDSAKHKICQACEQQCIRVVALQALLAPKHGVDLAQPLDLLQPILAQLFVFAYTWALGGNLTQPCQAPFNAFMHTQFAKLVPLPANGSVFDFFIDIKRDVRGHAGPAEMHTWASVVPSFTFNKAMPFFQMLVPTVDTVRFSFLLEVSAPLGADTATLQSGHVHSLLVRAELKVTKDVYSCMTLTLQMSLQSRQECNAVGESARLGLSA